MSATMLLQQAKIVKGLKAGLPARAVAPSARPAQQRKLAIAHAAASAAEALAEDAEGLIQQEEDESLRPFPFVLPKEPAQKALSNIPLLAFLPAMAMAVAGAGLVGNTLGQMAPVEDEQKEIVGYGTAAVFAGAAIYAAVEAKKKRDSASVVDLYNAIVDLPDPNDLTSEVVAQVGGKYGLNMHRDQLDGLKRIYGQFLESCIPMGDTQLKGDEAEKIRGFKEALGLSDEDAAPVHIETGRRFTRDGFETKDRAATFEKRKAFQRLIYVSQLVFGDQKAAFLLPWRRNFNLNDAQVFVARRDNARAIFRAYIEGRGGELTADRHFLHDLRERQTTVRLMDETAEEVVKEYARKNIEKRTQRAIDFYRATAKNKDVAGAVAEVAEILDYCRRLARLANEDDLVPGLGTPTLQGGIYSTDAKSREVKDVYKVYIDEIMARENEFTPQLEADGRELAAIFCVGAKESQAMVDEVAARLYRRLLKEEVTSGRLDSAASPASMLQTLCEKVRFSPESALELHRSLYKQKLNALLAEKAALSDGDAEDLKRVRRILCLPADVSKKVQKDVCGKALESLLGEVMSIGPKPVSSFELDRVSQLMRDLRLETDVAVEVMTKITRDRLRSYVTAAQKEAQDRREFAMIIKRMVQFNALCVTPVLERVKGMDAAKKELADILAQAVKEAKKEEEAEKAAGKAPEEGDSKPSTSAPTSTVADSVAEMRKSIQAQRGEYGEEERSAQKEITLKDDLEAKVKADIYKNYLMYSMTGDVVELPVGGAIRKKANLGARQTEMARLQSLSDLLGMDAMQVNGVQGELAEQAYKNQAQEVMRSGPLTEEKIQYLEEMRNQLGLPKDQADKALKAVRTEAYGSAAAAEEGQWTLERVFEVKKAGGNIDGLVEDVTRRNLYRRELQTKVADGIGELDAEYMLTTLPAALAIPDKKIRTMIKEEVSTRKRLLLVQAVSQFRQRRFNEVVFSLNNLISCNRLMAEKEPMAWSERSELVDCYQAFCAKEEEPAKRDQLRNLLGLSEEEADQVTGAAAMEVARRKADDADEDNFL